MKTQFNNIPSRSRNSGAKNTAIQAPKHTKSTDKGKELKENAFINKDVCQHGDSALLSSEDERRNNKDGVSKGNDNFDESVSNFGNLEDSSKVKTGLKPNVLSSKNIKLAETNKQQNFNDHTAEFCVVKCKQTYIGSKKSTKAPRQPMEKNFTLFLRAMNPSQQNLSAPENYFRRSSDWQKHARETNQPIDTPPLLLEDKSKKTKEKNGINYKLAVENGNASIGRIILISLNDKAACQKQIFYKASIDENILQKSNLDAEKKVCDKNNLFHLPRDLKTCLKKLEEPTYKEEKDKSVEEDNSNFIRYSSLILFVVILSFSYYQIIKMRKI